MQLDDDGKDEMLTRLVKQPRALIDAVEAAQPRTWAEIRSIIATARKSVAL
jgi:hypothetical protein